ncbi:MAG: hypothetical protein NWF00_01365 [Candidatus Bathyarchaeota archaeon]|nr:hypothetical protein [Candidatus Bathyarchaeota archaeon]
MVRPKASSFEEVVKELPKTLCDIPACGQMAKLVVEHGDFWLFFCQNHNPNKMKIVYPKAKQKKKK